MPANGRYANLCKDSINAGNVNMMTPAKYKVCSTNRLLLSYTSYKSVNCKDIK